MKDFSNIEILLFMIMFGVISIAIAIGSAASLLKDIKETLDVINKKITDYDSDYEFDSRRDLDSYPVPSKLTSIIKLLNAILNSSQTKKRK